MTHYRDPSKPSRERAQALLEEMTLEEKVAQLGGLTATSLASFDGNLSQAKLESLLTHGIGQISAVSAGAGTSVALATRVNDIQRRLVEHTRLGIPALFHAEMLNGVQAEGYTVFPTAIGLAAAWRPDLVNRMGDTMRRQACELGIRQGLSPVLDITRDARWGRVHETYGEEALLTSEMGVAFVSGLQGDSLETGVVATAKHFLGYSSGECGQNLASVQMGRRELLDVHAAPFAAVIKHAGLASVMNSYSDVDGVPVGISKALLTDLLRDELGFTGTVASDYRTLQYTVERQDAATKEDVGGLALAAGLDVELPDVYGFGEPLIAAVRAGTVDAALVDTAVLRVLEQKFALGLFEHPYASVDRDALASSSREGVDLALELAQESLTLLENRDDVLPLDPQRELTIAVVGPYAEDVRGGFPNYTYPALAEMMRGIATGEARLAGWELDLSNLPEHVKRAIEERQRAMEAIDPQATIREQYGSVSLVEALRAALPSATVLSAAGTGINDGEFEGIDAAVKLASEADVVILALGGRSAGFAGRATEGEGSDSATLELPSCQRSLVEAIGAANKPTVGVLFAGKPYNLAPVRAVASAMLLAYYPGQAGTVAIARAIAGAVNPSGKLPFTIPKHVGQVPMYQGQRRGSGQHRVAVDNFQTYVDHDRFPAFSFGHGLSYTTFEIDEMELSSEVMETDGSLTVRLRVRNTGHRAGAEVIQLYGRAPVSGFARPEQILLSFVKVALDPGEERVVECEIRAEQLAFTDDDGAFLVRPGSLHVRVGTSSVAPSVTRTVKVVGAATAAHRGNATVRGAVRVI